MLSCGKLPGVLVIVSLSVLTPACSDRSIDVAGEDRATDAGRTAASQQHDWPAYAGDLGATKYSPLDQINRDNVGQLRIAWRQSAIPLALRDGVDIVNVPANYQHTPLMIDGYLYMHTALGSVAALNPATGDVIWAQDPPESGGGASRGLAYWEDGEDTRIVMLQGQLIVELNSKNGARLDTFGNGGQIDLAEGYDRPVEGYRWRGPPMVVGDVIVVAGVPAPATDYLNENQRARKEAPAGDIRGYDVRTGQQLWTFHVVPRPGEFGYDTWLDGSAEYSGNSGAWSWLSADEELGYVYVPLEDPTGDFYGGTRQGDNLFSNSLLCLDAKTGERVWHFQAIHHGLWDYDLPAPPILADVTIDGRVRKLAVQLSKQAFAYVLDRETGEPIWPIEERPVPQGDTPGERYSPTQPIPTKPPPLELQGMTVDDLVDFTPQLRQEALDLLSQYRYGPLYTPASPNQPIVVMPGTVGGSNWNNGSIDPETGILYVPTLRLPVIAEFVTSKHPESNLPYVRRASGLPTNFLLPNGLPVIKPPYGSVVAVDLKVGEILWRVPNGEGPRDHPALAGLDLPPLGAMGRPSPLTTKTLLFLGEGMGRGVARIPEFGGGKMFRAYDKLTGDVVWEMELPGGTTSAPLTYLADGKQYIVVAVGWEEAEGELIALALP
jgi:quinoprotein glucose dehydrogenase